MFKRIIRILKSSIWCCLQVFLNRGRVFPVSYFELHKKAAFKVGKRVKIGPSIIAIVKKESILEMGSDIWLKKNIEIISDGKILIGSGVTVQDNVKILGSVEIGSFSIFAPNVFISSGGHTFKKNPSVPIRCQEYVYGEEQQKNITVSEDVWVGVNSVIMGGVVLGKGVVVGAGSVVTKSFEPYSIVGGVPAKKIGDRFVIEFKKTVLFNQIESAPYFYEGFKYKETNGVGGYVPIELKVKVLSPAKGCLEVEFLIDSKFENILITKKEKINLKRGKNIKKIYMEDINVSMFDSFRIIELNFEKPGVLIEKMEFRNVEK